MWKIFIPDFISQNYSRQTHFSLAYNLMVCRAWKVVRLLLCGNDYRTACTSLVYRCATQLCEEVCSSNVIV